MYFRTFLKILSLTLLLFSIAKPEEKSTSVFRTEYLKSTAVQIGVKNPLISELARDFLLERDGEKLKIWLFFTDKGLFSSKEFERAASSTFLSEKQLKRRKKTGLERIVFADLPVYQNYIEQVKRLGARHRRSSKWLNAASFEVSIETLAQVMQLPFISSIEPIAIYKRSPVKVEEIKPRKYFLQAQSADAINYGNSAFQLKQINVIAVHQRGYRGEGVTLAILDTGFRKSHEAFAAHYADGRVLAEYDFVFGDTNTANEAIDDPDQWNHGTYIWSAAGGQQDGILYGPAFRANFLLAKTEDIRFENQVEEDNWVAAAEWADSLGADVLTSSVGYILWYDYSDLDGETALITIAANIATFMGIVVCNAMGNMGPGEGTLIAPADAHNILSVGAVNSAGLIESFSSRGPTFDGRIKPEVCARGRSVWSGSANSDSSYTSVSGTSLSTPLIAGAASLLVQARPNMPPEIIRQALLETADNADSANNTYGWGVIDLLEALTWGAEFSVDTSVGNAPLTVQFTSNSSLPVFQYNWDFGDGGSSQLENPSYEYINPGTYDVTLTTLTSYGYIDNQQLGLITLYGDTLTIGTDSAFAGEKLVINVELINTQSLTSLLIPFKYGSSSDFRFDSVSLGSRTSYFEKVSLAGIDVNNNRYGFILIADYGGGSPPLAPGKGDILRIHLTIDSLALGGIGATIDTTSFLSNKLQLTTASTSYTPIVFVGSISSKEIIRGDANYDDKISVSDLVFLIDFIWRGGPGSVTVQSLDMNFDYKIDTKDITYLVDFICRGGPAPPTP
ncbi:MAG: S8 family serine peptidase [candidate division Zixibacteria bacterium]|nr:S8 family serine peptidase [candidate division Zixibacteria bacterium]